MGIASNSESSVYQRILVNGHPAAAIFRLHAAQSGIRQWLIEYSEPPAALGLDGETWQRFMAIVPEDQIIWTDECIDPETIAFGHPALRDLHLRFPAEDAHGDPLRRVDNPAYRAVALDVFAQIGAHRLIACPPSAALHNF